MNADWNTLLDGSWSGYTSWIWKKSWYLESRLCHCRDGYGKCADGVEIDGVSGWWVVCNLDYSSSNSHCSVLCRFSLSKFDPQKRATIPGKATIVWPHVLPLGKAIASQICLKMYLLSALTLWRVASIERKINDPPLMNCSCTRGSLKLGMSKLGLKCAWARCTVEKSECIDWTIKNKTTKLYHCHPEVMWDGMGWVRVRVRVRVGKGKWWLSHVWSWLSIIVASHHDIHLNETKQNKTKQNKIHTIE